MFHIVPLYSGYRVTSVSQLYFCDMATVKFYLPTAKSKGKLRDDEVSIVARFTIDRNNRFQVQTGEKIIPKYWNPVTQEVKSNFRGSIELNLSLNKLKQDLVQLWRENKSKSIAELKELAQSVTKYGQTTTPEKKTIYSALDKFLEQYLSEKDKKTYQKYFGLKNKLQIFNPNLTFQELDFNFYDSFKRFLYDVPNPNHPDSILVNRGDYYDIVPHDGGSIGLFDDTVFKYFILLKTFIKWAGKRGNQINPCYSEWPTPQFQHKPISLTLAELERLESAQLTGTTAIARDYLVMECRTGQRISDIKRLNVKDFCNGKWILTPKKGNRIGQKTVTIHFTGYCSPAINILQKYNFKLPNLSEQKINIHIKDACRIAGIDKHTETFRVAGNKRIRIHGPKYEFISSHSGRRSFCTIALQHMPAKIVMDLTGISNFKTLKHYEDESDHTIVENYLNDIQPLRKAN